MKRSPGPHEHPLPCIPRLSSLDAPVSPPRTRSLSQKKRVSQADADLRSTTQDTNLAALEAGQTEVTDHLGVVSSQLQKCVRPSLPNAPKIQIPDWVALYKRNQHPEGRHFVIHQHDHPIAGPHYDLRLQFSDSSSVSWSVMYGMPGDPNSRRLNRNATETRVHCLWVSRPFATACRHTLTSVE